MGKFIFTCISTQGLFISFFLHAEEIKEPICLYPHSVEELKGILNILEPIAKLKETTAKNPTEETKDEYI